MSVDKASANKITELFYNYLSKSFAIDIALQKATLEFINHIYPMEKIATFLCTTNFKSRSEKNNCKQLR